MLLDGCGRSWPYAYFNWILPQWSFSGPKKPNDETNNTNKQNTVKNPNWSAYQLFTKEKQLQLSGQSGS